MEPTFIPAADGAEVACDFTGAPDTPAERMAEYGRIFAHALVAREREGDGVVFTFNARPGVGDWVVDLVRREAACCPFLNFQVVPYGDEVVVRAWSDQDEAQPVLDEMYNLSRLGGPGAPVVIQADTARRRVAR